MPFRVLGFVLSCALLAAGQTASPKPPDAPAAFVPLLGEYGSDGPPILVHERDGKLTALIDGQFEALEPVKGTTFRFPESGPYAGRKAVFTRHALRIDGVDFPRRPDPAEPGATFRLKPVRSIASLRDEALAAQPPAETGEFRQPDLVELVKLDPKIKLDIRYASDNNFMSTPFYTQARAFLQRPAAEALLRVSANLNALGYGLLIHDAYRPWFVTKMFWEGTPPDKHNFVADPAKGSRHNRGCAVDLTLYSLATGKAIQMPGGYDEMSPRSFPSYQGGTSLQRWHRDLLRRLMEEQGFKVIDTEWWHFDYRDWSKYPIMNKRFEEL